MATGESVSRSGCGEVKKRAVLTIVLACSVWLACLLALEAGIVARSPHA